MSRVIKLSVAAAALGMAAGCDYTGDWLFSGSVEGVPAVLELTAEDGGPIVPVSLEGMDAEDARRNAIRAATIYGEVTATGDATQGGVTFEVIGTGRDICVWVDPETAYWNQSINPRQPRPRWAFPDNVFDDGDIELAGGQTVFYTGTPGESMGGFEVRYTDALGNEVPISLSNCSRGRSSIAQVGASAGRAAAEFCDLRASTPDLSYTIAMTTFSTPLDDDRMGFGVVVFDGSCIDLQREMTADVDYVAIEAARECVIRGESLDPSAGPGPFYGFDAITQFENAAAFEEAFCTSKVHNYCEEEEARQNEDGAGGCSWAEEPTGNEDRCFCGDPLNTPTPGAL